MVYERISRQVFELDGKDYTYWVSGDTSNPPLMILYGYTGVHGDFLELVRTVKQTHFVIIPEYPGWNGVPRFSESLTIHNYAAYFKKLSEHLHLERLTIIGHCVGGVVALEMAYVYPQRVRQLFLVSTPYLEGTRAHRIYAALAKGATNSPSFARSIFFLWRSRLVSVPLDFLVIKLKSHRKKMQRIKDHIVKQSSQREDAVEEEWLSFIEYDFAKVKQLTLPVHVIHGAKDLLLQPSQAKRLQMLLPSSTFDLIPHAGHVPPVETPGELLRIFQKYLPQLSK